MPLTPEGAQRILEIVSGESDDSLKGGAIVVSNGTDEARAPIEEFPFTTIVEEDNSTFARLTITATFNGDVANFDWTERRVASKQGVIIDYTTEDNGRKSPGSDWSISIDLDLVP